MSASEEPIVGLPPGARFLAPWQKIGIWAGVGVGAVAVLILFSGRVTFLHRAPPQQQPAKAQMNGEIAPLVRPMIQQTPAVQPTARPAYAGGSGRPVVANGEERKKALESDIGAYAMRGAAGAPVKAAAASQDDKAGADDLAAQDPLERSLTPTRIEGTRVAEMPNPRWLVEQGRVLPCIQQTRVNSTLPGGVTAIIPEPIRGETGDTVLLPKGAKVFGTIQHALLNGSDRLAVLWQNITTPVLYDDKGMPHQFRITANSPASSELGETGLDGDVNRHLLQKIGGIIGMSLIQGAIQAAVQEAGKNNGGTTLNLNSFQSGGNSAAEELLRSWVAIPDVMTRDQGLACAVFVMRDLDLHGAYRLVQSYRSAAQ